MLEVVVENRVDEVASISLSALVHLLQSAKIVHPEQLGALIDVVIAAHDAIDLVRALAQCFGQLSAHVLGCRFNRHLYASAEFLQFNIAHHKVRELVALTLFAGSTEDLVSRHLNNFILVVLQTED